MHVDSYAINDSYIQAIDDVDERMGVFSIYFCGLKNRAKTTET